MVANASILPDSEKVSRDPDPWVPFLALFRPCRDPDRSPLKARERTSVLGSAQARKYLEGKRARRSRVCSWWSLYVPSRSVDRRKIIDFLDNLFVVADTATKVACPGDESNLRNWRPVGARPWKHVADFGDLTLRFLSGGVEFWTKHLSRWILKGPGISPNQLFYGRNELAVTEIEAEWVKIALLEVSLSLVELGQCDGFVCLYSGHSPVEHGPGLLSRAELVLLRQCGG